MSSGSVCCVVTKLYHFLDRFECAKVLGARAVQISKGAPVMVELEGDEANALQIAMKELKQKKKIPIIVRRYLPDGNYEDWGTYELTLVD